MEASSLDSDELEDSYLDCSSSEDSILDANKEKKRKPDQVFVKTSKRSQDPGVPAAGIRIAPQKEAESNKQPALKVFAGTETSQKGSASAIFSTTVPNMFMEKPAGISKAAEPLSQSHVFIFGQPSMKASDYNGQPRDGASEQGTAKPMQKSMFRPEMGGKVDFAREMSTDEQEQRQNLYIPPNIQSLFSVPKKQEMELFSKDFMETNPFLAVQSQTNCFSQRILQQPPPPPP